MPGCPACGRPVALARPTCLYCGAALPATVAPPPETERAPAGATPGPPRVLVVLELSATRAEALARSGLGSYEAELLVRRGGLHLHRVLEAAAAEEEAARLAREGVTAVLVPEAEARVVPVRVRAGERHAGRLVLRGEAGVLEVPDAELLLVVSGPVARERRPAAERQKVDTARLEPGWLAHLHRR